MLRKKESAPDLVSGRASDQKIETSIPHERMCVGGWVFGLLVLAAWCLVWLTEVAL